MQEIKTNNFVVQAKRGALDGPKTKDCGRGCLSDNGDDLKRANLIDVDNKEGGVNGGHGDHGEDGDHDLYEGKDLDDDGEAGGVSTFVEIPMAGTGEGRDIQITGFQVPLWKGEARKSVNHETRTYGNEISNDGVARIGHEVTIQAGGVNILIYGGVREATLRTVMKVVMDHA